MSSKKSVLGVGIVLGVSFIICVAIKPSLMSLAAFALALIATFLASIYEELVRGNKKSVVVKDE